MTEEKITELVLQVTQELAALNANMKQVLETLEAHDARIRRLELHPSNAVTYQATQDKGEYAWIVQWLLKGLMISLGVIATLTGATGLIQKLIGD